MKKKLIAVILIAIMVFGLIGCSNKAGDKDTSGSNGATEKETDVGETREEEGTNEGGFALDGSWPAETIKIGFVAFDVTDEQFLNIQSYYEGLKEYFNIEFIYSESLDSAEDEMKFIENCAAAGASAIIGYYNIAEGEVVQLCEDKGMYYWGLANNPSVYEAFGDSEYYLGAYDNGDANYEIGYEMAKTLIQMGAKKMVYVSGGDEMGVDFFIDRRNGFYDAVSEAEGVEIIHKVPGWPGTDSFTAEQSLVLDMEFDALASSFSAALWFQPLASIGKLDGSIKMATVGNVSDMYYDAMNEGTVSAIMYECEEILFGNAIPMILNAVTGHMDANRNSEGKPSNFPADIWAVSDAEEFNTIFELHEDNKYFITPEDIANCLVEYNKEANYETLVNTYSGIDIGKAMEKVK